MKKAAKHPDNFSFNYKITKQASISINNSGDCRAGGVAQAQLHPLCYLTLLPAWSAGVARLQAQGQGKRLPQFLNNIFNTTMRSLRSWMSTGS